MSKWTLEDLRRLDKRYAEEGVHMHQRPFRAAYDILGVNFAIGIGGNPEVNRIIDAYDAMMPEAKASWPGSGIGIIASIDQVRKTVFPVVFGSCQLDLWQLAGFESEKEWWEWCREDQDIAADVAFAGGDIHDLTMGMNAVQGQNGAAEILWKMATSNLEDAANTLPNTFSHESVLQPICMVAELSIKASLVWGGVDPDSFRKGRDGHNLSLLVEQLAAAKPHHDDDRVHAVIKSLPPYVASRYTPAGLSRLSVVKLALGTQFIAASTLRRISGVDFATELESEGRWPGRRPAFIL